MWTEHSYALQTGKYDIINDLDSNIYRLSQTCNCSSEFIYFICINIDGYNSISFIIWELIKGGPVNNIQDYALKCPLNCFAVKDISYKHA